MIYHRELIAVGGPVDGTIQTIADNKDLLLVPVPAEVGGQAFEEVGGQEIEDVAVRTCVYYREQIVGQTRVRHLLRHSELSVDHMLDLLIESYPQAVHGSPVP